MCFAGFGVLSGRVWARVVGIGVVLVSAMTQFFYIPYYPIWAVLIIGLEVACIWALCASGGRTHGAVLTRRSGTRTRHRQVAGVSAGHRRRQSSLSWRARRTASWRRVAPNFR